MKKENKNPVTLNKLMKITRKHKRSADGVESINNISVVGEEVSIAKNTAHKFKKFETLPMKKLETPLSIRYDSGDLLVITKAKLKLIEKDKNLITKSIQNIIKRKSESQPLNHPSAGSVFKRGNIIPAQIIDNLGLKGLRRGDAQISTKHAGFIINLGNASSEDVKFLIKIIQDKVFENCGEKIEPEIEYVEY